MKTTGRTALIVGGTSGIGLEFAHQLTALGNSVVITGRDRERVEELATEHGFAGEVVDVTDAASITALRDRVVDRFPDLDTVLISSGIMLPERHLEADALEVAERTISTNLLGTIRVFTAFLPHLRTRPEASIITVTSGLAYVPMPLTPTYSATKAGVHAFTEAVRAQLRGTPVQLIELAPPLTRTTLMGPSTDHAGAMPLGEFVSEAIGLIQADPDIRQVLVDRVKPQRFAAVDGTYDELFENLVARL
ncbi:SDR family oxidoreductase [Saccharopolyspora gregorii]|uniref:SDR family oxidoreductase n=1 Tax=Saccharopolyspora gregorii TaxID=33914 RepID=UPI0021AC4B47|nr:SDR family NAD(P)-dependent oxidoreductase [Saccharopolyspora gregorii]